MRARSSGVALLAAAAASLLLAGCGGSDEEGTPALSAGRPLGVGGTLVWAVPEEPGSIDPLLARTRTDQLATRQIHEPLVATLHGPFGDPRRVPGLARHVGASTDATIWTLRLRTGVRFQDGTPFNAEAVLANVERWRTTAAGQALVPSLVDVFAPRPEVVRFILAQPDRFFDRRLAAPELGVVSPRALRPASGTAAVLGRGFETGTGPFELRERSGSRRLLARNTSWWGAAGSADLGPALEQVEFRSEPNAAVRLALLDAGDAQLADELTPEQARQARADPLLFALRGRGAAWLGLNRAVRGIASAREIPMLSPVWLADVTVGD